ncbi:hypothetical protein A3F07_01220 [candidate division WWE3 bacterium RIFCSPHIGHO2_12_FULL_38_15]|uniref:SbsA Ig-like domain-containing protein n=1 Tax=candidate division WWE3 bacterium RIFCSPHIGHO2_02_FULL_38_14 TaxID=1802620 RepID=A0A1F4V949_UNCKA|nr:MAG: hypothetical protein A2793_02075 [candidate division WWE3 bacterium RIFCSPHIGHO2_01_FULL_38_45]OGC48329.1 MAG: hypothetical protein A3F07_01220 [candidate division WWE3 bacterium RIFCSPHIGHO2_12_FULL_38_15]OGC53732.1 MAG: hypothetical protein A3D91_03805 [candidate division WWE3 bacterium RIFCSPHIGHO2_02_FULL_38_14]OGC54264.1 MAG: hypothetical protein A3B64_02020 [candidate division WWE3 bacterium RIFCSPLOWO2_01_FULL_37_24]HLB51507.1 hypothetical protein [Patescibacteria group bacterium
MLEKLKRIYNEHKVLVISVVIVILVAGVSIILSEIATRDIGTGLAPVITKEEEIEQKPKFPFNLVEASPPSGDRSTFDFAEYLYFKFSAPVDINSVSVKVTPTVQVKPLVNKSDPYTLILIPENGAVWQPNRRYTIIIESSLTSIDGVSLFKDITYKYYNDPPESIDFGEGDEHLR